MRFSRIQKDDLVERAFKVSPKFLRPFSPTAAVAFKYIFKAFFKLILSIYWENRYKWIHQTAILELEILDS